MNEWFNLIPFSLGAGSYEFFHQYGAELDRKSAINNVDLLRKAKEKGAELIS